MRPKVGEHGVNHGLTGRLRASDRERLHHPRDLRPAQPLVRFLRLGSGCEIAPVGQLPINARMHDLGLGRFLKIAAGHHVVARFARPEGAFRQELRVAFAGFVGAFQSAPGLIQAQRPFLGRKVSEVAGADGKQPFPCALGANQFGARGGMKFDVREFRHGRRLELRQGLVVVQPFQPGVKLAELRLQCRIVDS